jgi:hypothetical protein
MALSRGATGATVITRPGAPLPAAVVHSRTATNNFTRPAARVLCAGTLALALFPV